MNGANVVFNAEQAVAQTMNAPTVVSRDQLIQDLHQAGLSPEQVAALQDAIEEDGEVDGEPGPAVSGWFDEMRAQIAGTIWTTAWGLVSGYFGLPAAG